MTSSFNTRRNKSCFDRSPLRSFDASRVNPCRLESLRALHAQDRLNCMIIDKATTCYVVAVLTACATVMVVHDGYLPPHLSRRAHPAAPEMAQAASPGPPKSVEPSPSYDMPEELHPPTMAVFSLPDGADDSGTEDSNAGSTEAPPRDQGVVKPFRIVRDRVCRTPDCAPWTATDLETGKKSGAIVDLAPLKLARAIASPARKGIVDLLITAETLPDPEKPDPTRHLRAIKLEGVAPHHLAARAPLSSAPRAPQRTAGVVHASLPDRLAPNGF